MKEMDMIKIEIKIKKEIGLKIKLLKKMSKIEMKNNLKEEVKEITMSKMKRIHLKNNRTIEGEINRAGMIIIENFRIEEEDREEEREEVDIGHRTKQAMINQCIKILGNKIRMHGKMGRVSEEEASKSTRKKEIEIQILKLMMTMITIQDRNQT
jgi:hypothetical protein